MPELKTIKIPGPIDTSNLDGYDADEITFEDFLTWYFDRVPTFTHTWRGIELALRVKAMFATDPKPTELQLDAEDHKLIKAPLEDSKAGYPIMPPWRCPELVAMLRAVMEA